MGHTCLLQQLSEGPSGTPPCGPKEQPGTWLERMHKSTAAAIAAVIHKNNTLNIVCASHLSSISCGAVLHENHYYKLDLLLRVVYVSFRVRSISCGGIDYK